GAEREYQAELAALLVAACFGVDNRGGVDLIASLDLDAGRLARLGRPAQFAARRMITALMAQGAVPVAPVSSSGQVDPGLVEVAREVYAFIHEDPRAIACLPERTLRLCLAILAMTPGELAP